MLPGISPSRTTPLLLTTAPPIGKTISASTLRAMFHQATLAAVLSDKNYTPHSLWRGGASFCFQAGVPIEHIKKHGTWSSQAVDRYLLQHQAFQTPVALGFRQQLNRSHGSGCTPDGRLSHQQIDRPQAHFSVPFFRLNLNCPFFGASARPRVARSGSALTPPLHLTFYGLFLQGTVTRSSSEVQPFLVP